MGAAEGRCGGKVEKISDLRNKRSVCRNAGAFTGHYTKISVQGIHETLSLFVPIDMIYP